MGFNYREGLVLYAIGYEDGGLLRPVLYRASVAETCVPYGDPQPPFNRKLAFDAGNADSAFERLPALVHDPSTRAQRRQRPLRAQVLTLSSPQQRN